MILTKLYKKQEVYQESILQKPLQETRIKKYIVESILQKPLQETRIIKTSRNIIDEPLKETRISKNAEK